MCLHQLILPAKIEIILIMSKSFWKYFSGNPLLAAKVGGNFTPFLGFPFDDGVTEIVGLQPVFGTGNDLEKGFCLGVTLQFGLALPLLYPEDCVVGVAIDGLVMQTFLPTKRQGMHNSQELPDVVGAEFMNQDVTSLN